MQFWTLLHAHLVCRICKMHQRAIFDLAWLTWAFDYNLETCSLLHKRLDWMKNSLRKLVQMNPKEKCLWTIVNIWMKQPIWGGVYVLKSSKIPSEIIVHSHCKGAKNWTPLWLTFNRKGTSPRYTASSGTESISGNWQLGPGWVRQILVPRPSLCLEYGWSFAGWQTNIHLQN